MRLSAKEDVGASADAVFAALSDFDGFERAALRRGAELRRVEGEPQGGAGMRWAARFRFRGRPREAEITLSRHEPPSLIAAEAVSPNLHVDVQTQIVALSRTRSRIVLVIEARPRTLAARVMIQTARLARGRIERRLAKRLRAFAQGIEAQAAAAEPQPAGQWRRGSAG